MKNFIAGALALTLLGATAASAAPYGHGGGHGSYGHGYSRGYHSGYGGYRHGGDGALIGLGVGLFALAAIAASSNHDEYGPPPAYGYGPPPPPPPGYYNRGYDDYDR